MKRLDQNRVRELERKRVTLWRGMRVIGYIKYSSRVDIMIIKNVLTTKEKKNLNSFISALL